MTMTTESKRVVLMLRMQMISKCPQTLINISSGCFIEKLEINFRCSEVNLVTNYV